jgi:hypothetical protein
MRISLVMRAAGACAAATLVFSLSTAPSSARMGGSGGAPFGRPAFGGGHFSHFAPRGFNRGFDFNRFGFNHFRPSRFDHFGFNRFGPNRFDHFGFNRFGFDSFGGNQLFGGGWGWGDWGGGPVSTGASEPIIIGGGPPVIINIGADSPSGGAGAGYGGGCVTHKLIYDDAGKYVGEHQTSQC